MFPERAACGPLVLRRFVMPDIPEIVRLCGAPELALMTALVPHPYTTAMAEEWVTGQRTATSGEVTYAVVRVEDDALVGALGIRADVPADDMIGYWIGVPYWGRGYATAALGTGLALAFACTEAAAIRAIHLARNPASGRVMEKCGMVAIGERERPHRDGALERFVLRELGRERWERLLDAR